MSVRLLNFSSERPGLVESLRHWVEYDLTKALAFRKDVWIVVLDYMPPWDEKYLGGFHAPGPDGSLVYVEVHDSLHMDDAGLKWLIAHEARHAFQDQYDLEFGDKPPKNYTAYMEEHDARGEEVDADQWANLFTDYAGDKWWDEKIQ